MAKLVPLFSSSKGNSYYLSGNGNAILVDAGRNAKQIENALFQNDLSMNDVGAILVTHEHIDHCSAIKVLAKRYALTVYGTKGTLEALFEQDKIDSKTKTEVIEDEVAIGDFSVKRVDTSHDARESCGYFITTPDMRKCSFVTDTGFLMQSAKEALKMSNAAVIESNHDIEMLKCGPYPYILKKRILSSTGHLSNVDCAVELPKLVNAGLTRIILAHLSEENNKPDIALSTSKKSLDNAGFVMNKDYTMTVAPVETNGKYITF